MSVKVTIPPAGAGGAGLVIEHAEATHVSHDAGHLLVKQVSGVHQKNLAIYAPGRWVSAEVID